MNRFIVISEHVIIRGAKYNLYLNKHTVLSNLGIDLTLVGTGLAT